MYHHIPFTHIRTDVQIILCSHSQEWSSQVYKTFAQLHALCIMCVTLNASAPQPPNLHEVTCVVDRMSKSNY